jgi:hypothetical protein
VVKRPAAGHWQSFEQETAIAIVPNKQRRIIENDTHSDSTGATRQRVRMPYQPDTGLFGGWGIKL